MPVRSHDLHGSAPDKSAAILLLTTSSTISSSTEAKNLRLALPAGRNIAALKRRAKDAGIPTIYVNDNFGRWQSDFKKIVAHCREESRGNQALSNSSYRMKTIFVLKPKNRVLFNYSRPGPGPSRRAKPDPHRHTGKQLCLVHSQRRIHARLQTLRAFRLHCLDTEDENRHAEDGRMCSNDISIAEELDLKAMTS